MAPPRNHQTSTSARKQGTPWNAKFGLECQDGKERCPMVEGAVAPLYALCVDTVVLRLFYGT